eukprot:GHVU01106346.1.p1 GENE.GHVU01106346.1~~GHVU01106346.1.p1  ORF type:complete len:332 (+),score=64.92 GHVU01106346.1:833-1828(+)
MLYRRAWAPRRISSNGDPTHEAPPHSLESIATSPKHHLDTDSSYLTSLSGRRPCGTPRRVGRRRVESGEYPRVESTGEISRCGSTAAAAQFGGSYDFSKGIDSSNRLKGSFDPKYRRYFNYTEQTVMEDLQRRGVLQLRPVRAEKRQQSHWAAASGDSKQPRLPAAAQLHRQQQGGEGGGGGSSSRGGGGAEYGPVGVTAASGSPNAAAVAGAPVGAGRSPSRAEAGTDGRSGASGGTEQMGVKTRTRSEHTRGSSMRRHNRGKVDAAVAQGYGKQKDSDPEWGESDGQWAGGSGADSSSGSSSVKEFEDFDRELASGCRGGSSKSSIVAC